MQIGPTFDFAGQCHFTDNLNNNVVLTKKVWDDHLAAKPDRQWYVYNWDEIKNALLTPDEKRRSKKDSNVVLWYKRVKRVWWNEGVSVPQEGYWCVVVRHSKHVMTVYFTQEIKEGDSV